MIYEYKGIKMKKGMFNFMKEFQIMCLGEAFFEVIKDKNNKIIKKRILTVEEVDMLVKE